MKTPVPFSMGWGDGELTGPPCISARTRGVRVPKGPRAGHAAWGSSSPWSVGPDWQLPAAWRGCCVFTQLALPGCVPGKVCVVGAGLEGRPGAGLSPEGDGKPQKGLYCSIAALKEDASVVEGARRSLSGGLEGVLSLASGGGGWGGGTNVLDLGWDYGQHLGLV